MQSEVTPKIRIVPYEAHYAQAFYKINKVWIDRYFKMEPKDYETLEHPEESIIKPGGTILIALINEIPAGVCALKPTKELVLADIYVLGHWRLPKRWERVKYIWKAIPSWSRH